jgi:hypothetical protein
MINGVDLRFNQSASQLGLISVEAAFEMQIQLTNIAHEVDDAIKPVVLLDEIGEICQPTVIISVCKSRRKNEKCFQNFASLALSKLMNRFYLTVAGTKNGDLEN